MIKDKYFVTDSHCHIYPEKIAAKAVNGTDTFYGEHSVGSGTTENLLKLGSEAGIDHFIVQSVATTPKLVACINRFIAEEVEKSGGKFTGLGTLHPDSEDQDGDVAHLIELGLHGVKLHPDIQQFKIDDYRCLKIYELCEKKSLPILMHTGDYRYDFSNPNRLLPVMQIYTSLTVVGAHLGGWSVWDDAAEKLLGLDNLYFDCCSCMPYIDKNKVKELIRTFGAKRVLFGTDYPLWSPQKELNEFLSMELSDEENKLILSENAKRIYKIHI